MTERDDSGQFTAAEPLYGQQGLEADAGFVPLQDEAGDGELTPDEVRDMYEASGTPEGDIETHVMGLPDNVSVTLDQAAKAHSEAGEADHAQSEDEINEQIRKEVDELRGVEKPAEEKPAEPQFDPEKALEHPAIKEAISKVTADAETARANHVNGLAAATQMLEHDFFGRYPEFNQAQTPEQRMQVFAAIQQNEPGRAEQIRADVMRLGQLSESWKTENARATSEHQARAREYARAESEKFEAKIRGTPAKERAEIESAIIAAIDEHGGNSEQFARMLQSSEFASATVQGLLWEVGKARVRDSRIASATMPKPNKPPLPPVLRPGTPQPRNAATVRDLSARLSQTGNLDDAFALFQASRKAS